MDFSPLEALFRERTFKAPLDNEATTEERDREAIEDGAKMRCQD